MASELLTFSPVLSSTLRVVWLLLLTVSLSWPQAVQAEPSHFEGGAYEQNIRAADYGYAHFFADFTLRGNKESDKHRAQARAELCATFGVVVMFLLNPIESVVGTVVDYVPEQAPGFAFAHNVIRGPPRSAVLRSL